MTDQGKRYDRIAQGYARWWAPVLAPAVTDLLDSLEPNINGAHDIVDIGTGTGQLALGAVERWPYTSVTGVDASAGMCAMADAEADRRLHGPARNRFRSLVGSAEALPLPDRAFDVALSSFVFQLVARRARALREARRVLRPGGLLAYVTWLADERTFTPDLAFDDVLDELGIGEGDGDGDGYGDGCSGDLPSVGRAAAELRRAGFSSVTASEGWLEHPFNVNGYLAFLIEFDEETLFAELEPDVRDQLVTTLRARLEALSDDQMTMRVPIVFANGRRSS